MENVTKEEGNTGHKQMMMTTEVKMSGEVEKSIIWTVFYFYPLPVAEGCSEVPGQIHVYAKENKAALKRWTGKLLTCTGG